MASKSDIPTLDTDAINQRYITFLALSGLFTLFAVTCVILRFIQRRKIRQFWWDDWTILGSGIFSVATLITTIVGAVVNGQTGNGSFGPQDTWIKIWLAMNIIYTFCVFLSKASVVLFYTRIFSVHLQYLRALQIVGFVVAANFVVELCGFGFIDLTQKNLLIPLKTIDGKAFMIATCVMNLALDVIILAIPQFSVWKMKLSQRRRIALSLVFLLGGVVCIASIVRLVFFTRIRYVFDPTFDFAQPWIWTCVEMNMSIICACLPVAYGLFSGLRTKTNPKMTSGSLPYPQTSSGKYTSFGSRLFDTAKHGDYNVKVQSANPPSDISGDMLPLGPIRVDRVYYVSHSMNRERVRDVPDV